MESLLTQLPAMTKLEDVADASTITTPVFNVQLTKVS